MKFVVTIFSCELSPRIVGKIISRVSSTDVKRKTEIVRTWAIPSKWERPRISLIFCFQISPPITATGAVNSPDVVAEIFRAKCGFDTCEKIRPKMKRKKERKKLHGKSWKWNWTFANFWSSLLGFFATRRKKNEAFSHSRGKNLRSVLPLECELAKSRWVLFLALCPPDKVANESLESFLAQLNQFHYRKFRQTQIADIRFLLETITSFLIKHAELSKQVLWIMSRSRNNNKLVKIMREILDGNVPNCKISFKEKSTRFDVTDD